VSYKVASAGALVHALVATAFNRGSDRARGIRLPNPQIRSHEPEQTPQTSDDPPEKKSGKES